MHRPDRLRWAAAGASLLVLGSLLAAAGHDPAPAEGSQATGEMRMEGEFGMWVRFDGDSVRASWITRTAGPGFLEVSDDAGWSRSFETPPGISHTRAFRPPPGGQSILLTYGGRADETDRHRTRVRLEREAAPPPVRSSGVDSLFVVGDIHGEYDNFIQLLRNAELIDDSLRWSGGRSHLVALGDMMSRGDDVTAVLWFLYGLEPQVEEAGGRLHVVLGNHEIMVMLDDLRYVQQKEAWIAESHGTSYSRMFDPRKSVLGRWLASKPAVIQIEDVLLAHGGLSDDYLNYTVESHRDSLATFIGEDLFYHWADTTVAIFMDSLAFERRVDFFWGERSAFWYRGYAQADTLESELASVLNQYDSRLHVVGHTPVPTIREAYGGSLLMVNTVDFAAELLLLVNDNPRWERYRIPLRGPPEPIRASHAAGIASTPDPKLAGDPRR